MCKHPLTVTSRSSDGIIVTLYGTGNSPVATIVTAITPSVSTPL